MNGKQLIAAREKLGELAGLDRPLHASELGRALRLKGQRPGDTVIEWQARGTISGPASVAIEMMLTGAPPPDGWETILRGDGK